MCGRTAQTHAAVRSAASMLSSKKAMPNDVLEDDRQHEDRETDTGEPRDNFNLSPGMDAVVFWKEGSEIKSGRKVWGLVPRGGSATTPLEPGMSKHFANLMFNARSDSLFEKVTFSGLIASGRSCVVAVDGFFEWKTVVGKKQPYFVYRKRGKDMNRPYLLLAGLWTSVPTGTPDEPTLETFTIVTTEVCEPLKWLHSRMPVIIWDDSLAMAWLDKPTVHIHRQLELEAQQTAPNVLQWHAVTTAMASMKFRTEEAIKALPKMKTVKSFFSSPPKQNAVASLKRIAPSSAATVLGRKKDTYFSEQAKTDSFTQPVKKVKSSPDRPIDTFFQRKPK